MLYACVFVCKSVHDSLVVGVWRAAAPHAKLTPQAARVSLHRAQEQDTAADNNTKPPPPPFLRFLSEISAESDGLSIADH